MSNADQGNSHRIETPIWSSKVEEMYAQVPAPLLRTLITIDCIVHHSETIGHG